MERIIKFRAWDKEDNKMYEVASIDFTFEVILWKPNKEGGDTRTFQDFKLCDIMQYTGLKDKNGVEIYEGDILHKERSRYVNVIWDSEQGRWAIGNTPSPYKGIDIRPSLWEFLQVEFKVIGNIYENPELLEVSQ